MTADELKAEREWLKTLNSLLDKIADCELSMGEGYNELSAAYRHKYEIIRSMPVPTEYGGTIDIYAYHRAQINRVLDTPFSKYELPVE